MAKRLFKFIYTTDHGELSGLFISSEEEVTDLDGTWVSFGEVLGPGSEVDLRMGAENIFVLETSPETVEEMEAVCGTTICGYNPFDYLQVEPEDDDYQDQTSLPRS